MDESWLKMAKTRKSCYLMILDQFRYSKNSSTKAKNKLGLLSVFRAMQVVNCSLKMWNKCLRFVCLSVCCSVCLSVCLAGWLSVCLLAFDRVGAKCEFWLTSYKLAFVYKPTFYKYQPMDIFNPLYQWTMYHLNQTKSLFLTRNGTKVCFLGDRQTSAALKKFCPWTWLYHMDTTVVIFRHNICAMEMNFDPKWICKMPENGAEIIGVTPC